MDKVFLSLALIISGLTLGYVIQNLDRKKIISLPISIVNLRKTLQKMGLLFFMPISFLGAVWIVSFEHVRVVLLDGMQCGSVVQCSVLQHGGAHFFLVHCLAVWFSEVY